MSEASKSSSAPRQVVINVVGEVLSRIPQVVAEGLFAKRLGPARYGLWKALQLVINLSTFLNFGLPAGLGKELPRALGSDDQRRAAAMQRTGLTNFLLSMAFLCVVVLLLSISKGALTFLDLASAPGLLRFDLVAIAGTHAMFLYQAFLRARLRFADVALSTILFALFFLLAGNALLGSYGVRGIVLSYGGGGLLAVLYCQVRLGGVVVPGWDREAWILLAKTGLPLIGYAALQWLFSYVDRFLVLSLYSAHELGLYGFAALGPYVLSGISGSVTRAILPIIMRRLGRDGQIQSSVHLLLGTLLVMALFNSVASSALLPVLSVATHFYWPTYANALPIAWTLLAGSYFFTIVMLIVPYAIAADRQWAMNAWASAAVVINGAAAIVFVRGGAGLLGVGFATLVAQVFFCVTLYRDVGRALALPKATALGTFALALLPGIVVGLLWFAGGRLVGWSVLTADSFAQASLSAILWAGAHLLAVAPLALVFKRWLTRLFGQVGAAQDQRSGEAR